MGYLKATVRKTLRRSVPHGPRGKRDEPELCPTCRGTGSDPASDRDVSPAEGEEVCPTCGGTGTL